MEAPVSIDSISSTFWVLLPYQLFFFSTSCRLSQLWRGAFLRFLCGGSSSRPTRISENTRRTKNAKKPHCATAFIFGFAVAPTRFFFWLVVKASSVAKQKQYKCKIARKSEQDCTRFQEWLLAGAKDALQPFSSSQFSLPTLFTQRKQHPRPSYIEPLATSFR